MPAAAVDAHAHVIGLPPEFPLVPDGSYTAPPASAEKYLAMLDAVGASYGVLVQASVHGTDNRLMAATVKASRGRLRGIAVISPDVPDAELDALAEADVVGCRINVLLGGGIGWDAMEALAERVAPRKWHLQLLIDARALSQSFGRLMRLPVPFVIDHLGHIPTRAGVDDPGFRALQALLSDSNCWVKLSGAYRISDAGPPYGDTVPFAQALVAARPDRLDGAATGRMSRLMDRCRMSAISWTSWRSGFPTLGYAPAFSRRILTGFMGLLDARAAATPALLEGPPAQPLASFGTDDHQGAGDWAMHLG